MPAGDTEIQRFKQSWDWTGLTEIPIPASLFHSRGNRSCSLPTFWICSQLVAVILCGVARIALSGVVSGTGRSGVLGWWIVGKLAASLGFHMAAPKGCDVLEKTGKVKLRHLGKRLETQKNKAPRGGRTRNLEIKSLTLYRLS
jgi:hypothetical protein